ncbi:metallophosphoesterase [Methylorubrum aminovorans]
MAVYFTADTHFGHARLIREGVLRRPFASVEEHDEALIRNWNAVVTSPSDDVWHLGDFALGASPERCEQIFRRLRGRKHLVVGNHDAGRVTRLAWSSKPSEIRRIAVPYGDGQVELVLCHFAFRSWNRIHRGARHLFGHTHASLPGTTRSCDVGVDAWDFRPVGIGEILEAMALAGTWPEELAPATGSRDA